MLAPREPWLTRLFRLSLTALMVFAGVSHFVNPGFFTVMVQPQLPSPLALVLISGATEIGLGLGLLHPRLRRLAAKGLIALYIAVFSCQCLYGIGRDSVGRYPNRTVDAVGSPADASALHLMGLFRRARFV